MGNTDKNKTKKYRRKIRIRLADPNVPDSYVCEIFDSSLENEEENVKNVQDLHETKPKDYFELLMPKKCRRNGVINTIKENVVVHYGNNKELFEKNELKNQKNKNLLIQSDDIGKEHLQCETDSFEDESLLQIQEKFKLNDCDIKEESDFTLEVTEETTKSKILNKNIFTGIESSTVDISQKKTLGILNYFSKTQNSHKNKENCDLEEIVEVRSSLKTYKTVSTLKRVQQQVIKKAPQHLKNTSLNSKEDVKLAPLFNKKENKAIESAKQKARLEFLYKSSPPIIKKSENRISENVLSFPTIPHVQQRNDSTCWLLREIHLPFLKLCLPEECTFNKEKKFSLKIKHLNPVNHTVNNYAVKINKELYHKVKCKYLSLNLDLVFDGLKEKKEKFLARAEEIEKLKTETSNQDLNDNFEELNMLWTEKYKPKSYEILGNENVVRKVKKWLQLWKSFDDELKALVKTSRNMKDLKEAENDSDDDFLDSENENYGLKSPGNVCIISGPNGCGKSALVYALANELEFGVLELNASSKRTGKRVLSDLQEATQSHKVHCVNIAQIDTHQKEKEVKKKKNKKKKNKSLEPQKVLDQSNDSKISLILIEDADIVFDEHDEGFFPAIASLVQTSKRPLIFLTNDPNCHSFYNLKTEQCLILKMELPNFYISCALLDAVSSLEGVSFDKEIIESVIYQNNFDLRKSLLQLQFWVHCLKSPTSLQKKLDMGQFWWGLSKFLFKQDIKHFVIPKSRKRKRTNYLFDSSDDESDTAIKKFKAHSEVLKDYSFSNRNSMITKSNTPIESYFRILDLGSTLDCFSLSGSQEPIPGIEYKAKDSLSLDENMEETTWVWKNLAENISDELVSLSARIFIGKEKENENRKLNLATPCWEEIRWRSFQEKATQELSTLVPMQRGRDDRSLYLDYLPILRNICRVERNRSEINPKRKNRFYHYLNNLGFELNDENLEINCEIFNR